MSEETTIQCDCPHCGRICGFKSRFAGRVARCLNCHTRFVIPSESGRPARPLKPQTAKARPGFYGNALKGSFKAFVHRESRVGLIFYAALVVFHFLLGDKDLSFTLPGFRPPLLIGWAVTLITFGCFAWYSMETLLDARMDGESLPAVELGAGFEFLWNVIKSCYLFLVALLAALLPASLISAWFEFFGIGLGWLYYVLVLLCLLLWPMNLAIIALEVPWWRIFRYDLLIRAIVKTCRPYVFTTLMALAAFGVVFLSMGLFVSQGDAGTAAALGLLVLRLAGAAFFLFAMRIIGVYCRHYSEICPELWVAQPPQTPGLD